MQQTFGGIIQFLDPSSFNKWIMNNIILFTVLVLLIVAGVYWIYPKLVYWWGFLRKRRLYWKYQALVGRSMSKRAKDKTVGKEAYSMLLDLVQKGIITHKDKRHYLRLFELVLLLEPGTLRPKPGFPELKRKIRSRLSAESANASSIKPSRRLAAFMNSKG